MVNYYQTRTMSEMSCVRVSCYPYITLFFTKLCKLSSGLMRMDDGICVEPPQARVHSDSISGMALSYRLVEALRATRVPMSLYLSQVE